MPAYVISQLEILDESHGRRYRELVEASSGGSGGPNESVGHAYVAQIDSDGTRL